MPLAVLVYNVSINDLSKTFKRLLESQVPLFGRLALRKKYYVVNFQVRIGIPRAREVTGRRKRDQWL